MKAEINNAPKRPKYNEGDVFWMSVGENVGFEEEGKGALFARPILIVKGFSRELCWGVPLTSQGKSGEYYYPLRIKGKVSVAILSQMKVIDLSRISGKRMGIVGDKSLWAIKKRLQSFLK